MSASSIIKSNTLNCTSLRLILSQCGICYAAAGHSVCVWKCVCVWVSYNQLFTREQLLPSLVLYSIINSICLLQCVCVYACVCGHASLCVSTCVYVCLYVCACGPCVYVQAFIHVCISLHMASLLLTVNRQGDGLAGLVFPVLVVDRLYIVASSIRGHRGQDDQSVVQSNGSEEHRDTFGHYTATNTTDKMAPPHIHTLYSVKHP